eukprot:356256-Chlamydomonas_euryale.AAC.3
MWGLRLARRLGHRTTAGARGCAPNAAPPPAVSPCSQQQRRRRHHQQQAQQPSRRWQQQRCCALPEHLAPTAPPLAGWHQSRQPSHGRRGHQDWYKPDSAPSAGGIVSAMTANAARGVSCAASEEGGAGADTERPVLLFDIMVMR